MRSSAWALASHTLTAQERYRIAAAGVAGSPPRKRAPITIETSVEMVELDTASPCRAGRDSSASSADGCNVDELPELTSVNGDPPTGPRRVKSEPRDLVPGRMDRSKNDIGLPNRAAPKRSTTTDLKTSTVPSELTFASLAQHGMRTEASRALGFAQRLLAERLRSRFPTYYCQICLFHYDAREGVAMACGHLFCPDCLGAYMTVKIAEGQVLNLRCPHVDSESTGDEAGCDARVDVPTLRDLLRLDAALVDRYTRFVAARTNDLYRECPSCTAPNTDGPTSRSNELRCAECSTSFCFVHADAHPGIGCR